MAYSTIPKGSLYMNTKLYTGNGSQQYYRCWISTRFNWIKARGATTDNQLFDSK